MVRCLRSVLYASVVFAVIGGVQAGPVSPDEGSGITGATPAVLSAAYRDFHDRVVEISKLRLDQPKNVVHAQKLLVAPNEKSRKWAGYAAAAVILASSLFLVYSGLVVPGALSQQLEYGQAGAVMLVVEVLFRAILE